ncbi:MAG: thioredoxin family protein [Bacteroidaceae bacterium]|nr:thioredoxin family protein [Bacteroidaceae bacterium]
MRKLLSIIALFCTLGAAAQFASPVKFTVKENKVSDSELELVFTGKIDAGWHVYGTDIKDGGPTKAELTLEKQSGVKPKGGLKGKGNLHKAMDEMFGMEVSYYEGSVTFVQAFTITEEKYNVEGYLTYGACNDQNCIPPTDVDFKFEGTGKPSPTAASPKGEEPQKGVKEDEKKVDDKAAETLVEEEAVPEEAAADTVATDSTEVLPFEESGDAAGLWTPVISELKSFGEANANTSDKGLLAIFLLGLVGGFIALLTPCVWPIIPMTVSFFLKRNKDDKAKGIRDAVTYGLSIVVIYVALGLFVTLAFGASALNDLSTNAGFNIFFCLMLLVFAASFMGGFELTLPSSWGNAVDSKANKTTGVLSIFLMAFTLSLVSFSCTGPIIGFLLVEMGTSGSIIAPTVGMLGFAIALALPFTLFAMFPTWLKSAPKSGNWMNCIKVCLGFLELAFALKFLSVADMAYQWHILDREVFLSLWIVIFALMGAYLIGWIRFPHDEDEYDEMGEVIVNHRTGVTRFFLALLSFAFAIYMVPGLWGAPCKAVSAFAPPMSTQDFNLAKDDVVEAQFVDYEEGMAYAKQKGLPVMLDFTGYGCVNCREMEAKVWTDPEVKDIIRGKYVLISLYVDEKTALAEPEVVKESDGSETKLRRVGDKWSYLQRVKFGAQTQPFYVLLDNEGNPLNTSYSHDEDIQKFVEWLNKGIENYKK